jgi:hypothetical protein
MVTGASTAGAYLKATGISIRPIRRGTCRQILRVSFH